MTRVQNNHSGVILLTISYSQIQIPTQVFIAIKFLFPPKVLLFLHQFTEMLLTYIFYWFRFPMGALCRIFSHIIQGGPAFVDGDWKILHCPCTGLLLVKIPLFSTSSCHDMQDLFFFFLYGYFIKRAGQYKRTIQTSLKGSKKSNKGKTRTREPPKASEKHKD